MIYIETRSHTPAVNLAFEEYFLKSKDLEDNVCMLWQNEPAIVVGRFQNTMEEINLPLAKARNIHIIRRISGGGAVYHDLGNLCFSFIMHDITPEIVDKSKYARPLVNAFSKIGVQVTITKRNDLTIAGKKFSGNAMALHKNRLLFHGTLLFDSDLETLQQVLEASPVKIESKGIKSVKSSVTNIKPYLPAMVNILEFKHILKQHLFKESPGENYDPPIEDLEAIQKLVADKYSTWGWNIGNNPPARITHTRQFPAGTLEAYLELEKGVIKKCRMQGNFKGLNSIEQRLTNIRFIQQDIQTALDGLDLNHSIGAATQDELVHWILGLA